jgi:hypothetical protein
MDMGPMANERARQTVYSIRRWNFFKAILTTWCGGEVVLPQGSAPRNHEITRWEIKDFEPRINAEGCYGHGTRGK